MTDVAASIGLAGLEEIDHPINLRKNYLIVIRKN